jgi:hypothetical protein
MRCGRQDLLKISKKQRINPLQIWIYLIGFKAIIFKS